MRYNGMPGMYRVKTTPKYSNLHRVVMIKMTICAKLAILLHEHKLSRQNFTNRHVKPMRPLGDNERMNLLWKSLLLLVDKGGDKVMNLPNGCIEVVIDNRVVKLRAYGNLKLGLVDAGLDVFHAVGTAIDEPLT